MKRMLKKVWEIYYRSQVSMYGELWKRGIYPPMNI